MVNDEAGVNEKFITEMCPTLCKDAYTRHNAAVKVGAFNPGCFYEDFLSVLERIFVLSN